MGYSTQSWTLCIKQKFSYIWPVTLYNTDLGWRGQRSLVTKVIGTSFIGSRSLVYQCHMGQSSLGTRVGSKVIEYKGHTGLGLLGACFTGSTVIEYKGQRGQGSLSTKVIGVKSN